MQVEKRDNYPPDCITVKNKINPLHLHNYNGNITDVKIKDDQQITYVDGVIKIKTVSPKIRNNALNILQNRQTKFSISALLSLTGVGGGTYALFQEMLLPGSTILIIGTCGLFWSAYHLDQISSEIEKWKCKLNDYLSIRRNIPKNGFSYVYEKSLKNKFLTTEEANKIWSNSVLKGFNDLRAKKSDYENNNYRDKAIFAADFIALNPLMQQYVNYFESDINLNHAHIISEKVHSINSKFNFLVKEFTDKKSILRKENIADKIIIERKYYPAQQLLSNANQFAHYVNNHSCCDHYCTCRDSWFKDCSTLCDNRECHDSASKKNITSLGIELVTNIVETPIKAACDKEKSIADNTYIQKIANLESNYNVTISNLIPELFDCYNSYFAHKKIEIAANL